MATNGEEDSAKWLYVRHPAFFHQVWCQMFPKMEETYLASSYWLHEGHWEFLFQKWPRSLDISRMFEDVSNMKVTPNAWPLRLRWSATENDHDLPNKWTESHGAKCRFVQEPPRRCKESVSSGCGSNKSPERKNLKNFGDPNSWQISVALF